MEFIETYWIYCGVALLAFVIGRFYGKHAASQEMMYFQQQQMAQDQFNQYINGLQQAGGTSSE